MADDFGFQPAAAPQDGFGFQPAPKIPDMSGAQKTAQDNLAANDNKEPSESGEPKPIPTPHQRLDTATGMPIQSVLNGSAKPTDVPQSTREDYSNLVKSGSMPNGGSYMQTMLHSVLPIVAGGIQRGQSSFNQIGDAIEQTSERYVGTMAYPFLSPDNQQKLIKAGIVPPEGGEPISPDAPPWVKALHGASEGISPVSVPLNAAWMAVSAPTAPILNPAIKAASDAVPSQYSSVTPDILNLAMTAGGLKGLHYVATRAGTQFPAGTGPWDNHLGSDIIKPEIANQVGKEHSAVTSDDFDQTIAKGSKGLFPDASDYKTVADAMNTDANVIHDIYEKTGVHPEQIFKDAQSDSSIAEDIGAGKIPAAYSHLLDTRPAIPDDVAAGMAHMDALSKEQPPVDLSKEGASTTASLSALAKIFNPTGMSDASGDMATALRQGRGPVEQYVAQIQDGLSKFSKTISGMTDKARLDFIHYIESRTDGGTLDDPKLQPLADKIRDIYSTMADKILKIFPDVKMRQDYFTHQYKDEAAAAKFFSDWAAKQGSERNLQQRTFPTLREAMEAKLEPKSTNPIDTVMNYVTNIGKIDAAHKGLNLALESGIASFFDEGHQPDGWVPLGGKLAEQGDKMLYAPEDAARVYNNDISKGFTGPIGGAVDAVGRVNNFNNMLILSLSAYHATVTTLSSMSKDVGRVLTQGSLTDRAGALLSAVTPLKNTIQGGKLIDAYLGREQLTPEAQKTMDALVKNNAVNIRQQDYWKAGPARTYIDVFQHGNVGEELQHAKETISEHPVVGVPMVIANEAGRVMNSISSPLFEHYIPRIKMAASFNEMHTWMREHPDATEAEIDKAAQDIGNNSDNAFGEMNRDNLFWHNITRQTLQTAFLSYSWIAGAARMLQGIPDIGKTIMGKQELTSNARYLLGMAATYAAVNGVRTYLGTGHAPNQVLDFIYPRTGGTTPEGKEERALIPSHIGQFTQYLFHGIEELGNEASPTLKLLKHLLTNEDFRGLPITNANNKWYEEQRWDDYAKYVLGEETPIGLKTFITGPKKGSDITPIERGLGVRQAPREITDPEGYDDMMERVNDSQYRKKVRSDEKMANQYEGGED